MGRAKEDWLEHQENLARAGGFLVKMGTLSACEAHGDLYDGDGDLEAAYKRAAYLHKRGELGFGDDLSQREVTDLLKEAYEDNAGVDVCPRCDYLLGQD